MKLLTITVSYGATQSLPEYSNVKPSITLTAQLDPDDDPNEVEQLLWRHAKISVHEEIDRTLELCDRAARYSDEPRYQVLRTYWNEWEHRGETKPPEYIVIVPNGVSLDRKVYDQRLVHTGSGDSRKLRYHHARRLADAYVQDGYTLLDCSSGELTPLDAALSVPAPQMESNPEVAPTDAAPF
jgi:hypothetical protein